MNKYIVIVIVAALALTSSVKAESLGCAISGSFDNGSFFGTIANTSSEINAEFRWIWTMPDSSVIIQHSQTINAGSSVTLEFQQNVAPGDIFVFSAEGESDNPKSSCAASDQVQIVEPNTIRADVNRDLNVDVSDLLLVVDNWGTGNVYSDVDMNQSVNVTDLLRVIGSWGNGN